MLETQTGFSLSQYFELWAATDKVPMIILKQFLLISLHPYVIMVSEKKTSRYLLLLKFFLLSPTGPNTLIFCHRESFARTTSQDKE